MRKYSVFYIVFPCYLFIFLLFLGMRYQFVPSSGDPDLGFTVIIDAGHGGEDGGAVSLDGIKESVINLSVSQKLEQLLVLMGVPTKMTRSEDVSLCSEGDSVSERKTSDLKNRAAFVNQMEDAVLVSIHQNHFPQSQYYGAQVFYAETNQSRELAALVQHSLKTVLDQHNRREIKPASSVYLLNKVDCPAVLVECGFLSNPLESAMLQNDRYQKLIACSIGQAVVEFIKDGDLFEV